MNLKEYLKTVKDVELTEEKTKELDKILGVEKVGEWVPGYGEDYFFLRSDGCVLCETYNGFNYDENRILLGNCYKTEDLAEKESRKRFAIARIKKEIKRLNDGWVPNWEDKEQEKNEIYYSHEYKKLCKTTARICQSFDNEMYLRSDALAEKLIDSHEKDLKLMLGIEV